MLDEKRKKLMDNFRLRNIEVTYFENLEAAAARIEAIIPVESIVGIGNSRTLKEMGITNRLQIRGNIVYDKTLASSKEESKQLKKQALLADWYITGSNAVSAEGQIVNIDHSGNRVAAMVYGPEKVIVVVGKNKICNTFEEAVNRARHVAAPLNAKRAGYNPPCIELKRCVDCQSKERVCFNRVIIEGQYDKERMKLFIVDEVLGF